MRTNRYQCVQCDKGFIARVADRNRGWARFCSKSCKAKRQERVKRLQERVTNGTSYMLPLFETQTVGTHASV